MQTKGPSAKRLSRHLENVKVMNDPCPPKKGLRNFQFKRDKKK